MYSTAPSCFLEIPIEIARLRTVHCFELCVARLHRHVRVPYAYLDYTCISVSSKQNNLFANTDLGLYVARLKASDMQWAEDNVKSISGVQTAEQKQTDVLLEAYMVLPHPLDVNFVQGPSFFVKYCDEAFTVRTRIYSSLRPYLN